MTPCGIHGFAYAIKHILNDDNCNIRCVMNVRTITYLCVCLG